MIHPCKIRVVLEFYTLLATDTIRPSTARRLILVKRAMHTVADGMRREEAETRANGTDDELGWVLSFVRAAERVDVSRTRRRAREFPKISENVNPENPEARTRPSFWKLKDLAA